MRDTYLVLGESLKIKAYGEHIGKYYYVYFENISADLLKYQFHAKWAMEEFLYTHGIERFDYKSSNGKVINKVWKYIPEEIEDWRNDWCRTKTEKQRGMPEKYTFEDWQLGHYIKDTKVLRGDT